MSKVEVTCICGKCKFKVTKKMQIEMNKLRKELGLPEEEIKPEFELGYLRKWVINIAYQRKEYLYEESQ